MQGIQVTRHEFTWFVPENLLSFVPTHTSSLMALDKSEGLTVRVMAHLSMEDPNDGNDAQGNPGTSKEPLQAT